MVTISGYNISTVTKSNLSEIFISVDVETAGPNPAAYAMLSIGACLVNDPEVSFYVELQPDKDNILPSALAVSGLSMKNLAQSGVPPQKAMQDFADWVAQIVPQESSPVFVAFNAVFDWMFVDDYFHRYLGENPFGYAALDIKAYYMGLTGVKWGETKQRIISKKLGLDKQLTHNALRDAQDQAALFVRLLEITQIEE